MCYVRCTSVLGAVHVVALIHSSASLQVSDFFSSLLKSPPRAAKASVDQPGTELSSVLASEPPSVSDTGDPSDPNTDSPSGSPTEAMFESVTGELSGAPAHALSELAIEDPSEPIEQIASDPATVPPSGSPAEAPSEPAIQVPSDSPAEIASNPPTDSPSGSPMGDPSEPVTQVSSNPSTEQSKSQSTPALSSSKETATNAIYSGPEASDNQSSLREMSDCLHKFVLLLQASGHTYATRMNLYLTLSRRYQSLWQMHRADITTLRHSPAVDLGITPKYIP